MQHIFFIPPSAYFWKQGLEVRTFRPISVSFDLGFLWIGVTFQTREGARAMFTPPTLSISFDDSESNVSFPPFKSHFVRQWWKCGLVSGVAVFFACPLYVVSVVRRVPNGFYTYFHESCNNNSYFSFVAGSTSRTKCYASTGKFKWFSGKYRSILMRLIEEYP